MSTAVETGPPSKAAGPASLKDAARLAKSHVADLFEQRPEDLLLEELEGDDERWHVTLSMPSREEHQQLQRRLGSSALAHYLAGGYAGKREYKVVDVRKTDGEILGVHVRSLVRP